MRLSVQFAFVVLLVAVVAVSGCASPSGGAKPKPADPTAQKALLYPALAEELHAMVQEDQRVRAKVTGTMVDAKLAAEMQAVDRRNTERLKAIIDEYGWPGPRLVGRDGTDAAWLLVQHADHDRPFQKHMLYMLRPAVVSGDLSKQNYALLTDRVLVADGKPQRYGSQIRITQGPAGIECEPFPIEDPENLDKRRAEMGLEPHADYMERIRAEYAGPA